MTRVSIVTVSLNSAQTIADCIESVKAQTHPDVEHVIVDGLSDDGTVDIIRRHGDAIDTVIVERDQGIYDAMNKGIRAATGDVLGMLNADDVLQSPETVSRIAKAFEAGYDAVCSDVVIVSRQRLDEVVRFVSARFFSPRLMRFGLMCPHPTFYVRRELFDRLGYYKTDYRVSADFELMARFMKTGLGVGYLPEVTVRMRSGGISTTGLWGRAHQNLEIVRALRENGIYSNLAMLSVKLPVKLAEYAYKKKRLKALAARRDTVRPVRAR